MNFLARVRLFISFALAIGAALLLVGVNEFSYQRSRIAMGEMRQLMETRTTLQLLLRQLLDAETGQRGYLITGSEDYLKPYQASVGAIEGSLKQLETLSAARPDRVEALKALRQHVTGKLGELEVTVRLRGSGEVDAWRSVTDTDIGQRHMDAIRSRSIAMIDDLSREIGLAQEQIESTLQLARAAIAASSLIGLLAFILYLRQTQALQRSAQDKEQLLKQERDLLEDTVRHRTAQLTELANYLIDARAAERGRLARELHDELGALLTAAKLDLARLKSRLSTGGPEVLERMQHLADTLNSGIALKRRIIEDLRPSSLANLGLAEALEILAREFAERSGLQVDTQIEPVTLSPAAELTVYRLVQESLTNIAKYAQARQVRIQLRRFDGQVRASVRDDGVGFEPAGVNPSAHGLKGMQHRLAAARGRLEVDSAPGQGTSVNGYLPL